MDVVSERVVMAFFAGVICGVLLFGWARGRVAHDQEWRAVAERAMREAETYRHAWLVTDSLLATQMTMWSGEPRWTVLREYGPGGTDE